METSYRHSRRAGLVLLLASCLAAVAVQAAIRPTSPDEFRKLLLWAERAADRSIHKGVPIPDFPSLAELNEVDNEWIKEHRQRTAPKSVPEDAFKSPAAERKLTPAEASLTSGAEGKSVSSTVGSPVAATRRPGAKGKSAEHSEDEDVLTASPPPMWSHSLLAEELSDPLSMRRLPAHEEYDRNERYSHSFLHGFNLGF